MKRIFSLLLMLCILLGLFAGCAEKPESPENRETSEKQEDNDTMQKITSESCEIILPMERYRYTYKHGSNNEYESYYEITLIPQIGFMEIAIWPYEYFGYTEKDDEIIAVSQNGKTKPVFRRSGDDIIFNADKSVVGDSDETWNERLNGLKGGEKFGLIARGEARVFKADTDGNGTAEYWCGGVGPTSGRYSSLLLAFSDGKLIFNEVIYDTLYHLKAENGKLYFGLSFPNVQMTDREFEPEYDYVEMTTKNGLVFADGLMIRYYNELYHADLVLNTLAKLPEKADPLFLSSDSRAYLNSPHKEELDALLEQVKNAKIERKNPQTKEEENECISELDEKLREFNQLYTDLDNLINTMLEEFHDR